MRALRWHDVDLTGQANAQPSIPPSAALVRSVRVGGDTKTRKSRRALELPGRAVEGLRELWDARTCGHIEIAECSCLVFATRTGTGLAAGNVRRDFRKVMDAAGLTGKEWAPRELRHSFVSLLSDKRVPVEVISRLVGHPVNHRHGDCLSQAVAPGSGGWLRCPEPHLPRYGRVTVTQLA